MERQVERIETRGVDPIVICEQDAHYSQDSAGTLQARRSEGPGADTPRSPPLKGAILEAVPVIFICGGARSGKSRKALELALAIEERPAFIATGEALDGEMAERIARHRAERGGRFETVEAPRDVAAALSSLAARKAIVVDCLTLWLSNVMLPEDLDVEAECARLAGALERCPATVIVVSNEVGCGIVPENALARRFRDEMGRLNTRIAALAEEVYWMVCGCELRMK